MNNIMIASNSVLNNVELFRYIILLICCFMIIRLIVSFHIFIKISKTIENNAEENIISWERACELIEVFSGKYSAYNITMDLKCWTVDKFLEKGF